MTTGLDYQGFVNQIAALAVVDPTDPNFVTILPQAITYVENRICRELDFLFTSISNTTNKLTANSRTLTIPAGSFVVTEQINVITPVNVSSIEQGVRNPLLAVTREFLDATCSDSSNVGLPKYFAPVGDRSGNVSYIVGPYPDADYRLELVGTIRPDSLSATNTKTFISTYLPDLMIMGAMIYVSGYQRNFSSTQANDPQMPVNYETQYKTLLMSAAGEEFRKKMEAAAWSPKTPSPVATPTRG